VSQHSLLACANAFKQLPLDVRRCSLHVFKRYSLEPERQNVLLAGFTGCFTGMRLNNRTDFGFREPISGQKKAPRKVLRLLQYFKHGSKD